MVVLEVVVLVVLFVFSSVNDSELNKKVFILVQFVKGTLCTSMRTCLYKGYPCTCTRMYTKGPLVLLGPGSIGPICPGTHLGPSAQLGPGPSWAHWNIWARVPVGPTGPFGPGSQLGPLGQLGPGHTYSLSERDQGSFYKECRCNYTSIGFNNCKL